MFDIQATYGTVYFAIGFSPNYEAPADADGNGSYEVIVQASNGTTSDQQALTFHVYNVNEGPVFTSFGGAASASTSVAENGLVVATIGALDPEGMTFSPTRSSAAPMRPCSAAIPGTAG